MLCIRLARIGARKKPHYRVVLIEKERARNGRFVEILGHYHPGTSPAGFTVDRERINHWISKGAQPSSTIGRLLARTAEAGS